MISDLIASGIQPLQVRHWCACASHTDPPAPREVPRLSVRCQEDRKGFSRT